MIDDAAEDCLAGLHHLARDGIRFQYMQTTFAEHTGDGCLAAAKAAGEACSQSASPIDTARNEELRRVRCDCKAMPRRTAERRET